MLQRHFGTEHTITYKGKLDLVTEADRRSEDEIVGFLVREFPEHGILAEERSELPAGGSCRWILDPLDGTTNFAHGYPFYCVSLAFEQNGDTVWGAVHDPVRDEVFTAEQGAGAFLNGSRLSVSSTRQIEKAMLCTGFPYDVHESAENNIDHFVHFIKTARAVRRDGAAALDLCYVAAGRFDGFWEMKLKPWDLAAGCLVVCEAGGTVTGFDGSPLVLERGDVVASNTLLHKDMLNILMRKKEPCAC